MEAKKSKTLIEPIILLFYQIQEQNFETSLKNYMFYQIWIVYSLFCQNRSKKDVFIVYQYKNIQRGRLLVSYYLNQIIIVSNNSIVQYLEMQNQFQCTKIKDALYLGSLASTQDFQFLQTNKFSYLVNCSAQIPNYYDNHGIKYLKFKLIKERSHKLWDQSLKKLRKMQKFIEQAEQQSLCCIIFSSGSNNRSLVMLTAYLMSKYRWTLCKALEYIKSKKIFIGLTQHYISQLQMLEALLVKQQDKPQLTSGWKGPYQNDQQEIISKTYMNSQEIILVELQKKQKKEKRITWQDKIDKQKKKEGREIKMKQTELQAVKKVKSSQKFMQDAVHPHNSLSNKVLKSTAKQSPLKRPQNLKKNKNTTKNASINKIQPACQEKQSKENFIQFQQQSYKPSQQVPKNKDQNKYFSQKELLKLIKKNLKIIKQDSQKIQSSNQQNQVDEKGIYNLTINNFIAPNINIMNQITDKPVEKLYKNTSKVIKKEDKHTRVISQKETGRKNANESLKGKAQKNRSFKGNTQNSPKSRQRKLQKAVSLQFKKNH